MGASTYTPKVCYPGKMGRDTEEIVKRDTRGGSVGPQLCDRPSPRGGDFKLMAKEKGLNKEVGRNFRLKSLA